MSASNNIQKFLNKKFNGNGIGRKAFCNATGIPYSTLSNLLHSISTNPDFITIIKTADYFNVSIDSMIGRKNFIPSKNLTINFYSLTLQNIHCNLYNFLKKHLALHNISTYLFSKNIGFSKTTIHCFLKTNSPNSMLSTNVIIAIADYFNVSIDSMIGRSLIKNN